MLQLMPNATASLPAAKRRCVSRVLLAHRRPKRSSSLLKQQRSDNMLVKSKSPTAFRKNIKAEVAAGKPVKQAVAISYSVKREAMKKKGK